jgi:hypothetical protein
MTLIIIVVSLFSDLLVVYSYFNLIFVIMILYFIKYHY